MAKKIIRLCYRKVIDATSSKPWDKYVFENTYAEFLMQAPVQLHGQLSMTLQMQLLAKQQLQLIQIRWLQFRMLMQLY